MIGGVGRHGRTRRDAANLAAHLLKDSSVVVRIANSVAPDLESLMEDMLLARDGTRASSAFLHMHLSPAREMSEAELRRAAMVVLKHFGAEDHPAAFVIHEKEREGGKGVRHCHLVVGRVGPEGQVLPSGFEIMKMETAVRVAEFELGEPPTLGRHHASALRWLRQNGREDVADWLEAAFGPDPQKPRSAASPRKRQAAERKGVPFAKARSAVKAAWAAADTPTAFRQALAAAGLSVVTGRKPDLWIVRAGEAEVGSLDRIVRQRRASVTAFMAAQSQRQPQPQPRPQPRPVRLPRPRPALRPEQIDRLAEVDLDELRWRAEAYGRAFARSIVGTEGKERLRASIQSEIFRIAKNVDHGKPVELGRTRRPGHDTPEEMPHPRPRM